LANRKRNLIAVCSLVLGWALHATAADKISAPELIQLAKSHSESLQQAMTGRFDSKDLANGTAWAGHGPDFFFAISSTSKPVLMIDDAAGPEMQRVEGTDLWYSPAHIEPLGKLHGFHYIVNSVTFGGSRDVPAFGPLSYLQPGVPMGKLSEKVTHTSKIYDGMKSEYWVYVSAQYDPKVPAALMVFQDGGGYIDRERSRTLDVIDNLIAHKKIPVMICIFVNPGQITGSPDTPTYKFVKAYSEKWHRSVKDSMRSTLYDTVSDRYPRYLRDEILAEVEARYNIRKDSYSRAITGLSSGGICAFNAAWQMPDQFSRVLTWIGSFTSIQWKEDPGVPDGGQDYAEKVLREPKRNLRVWLQDGSDDLEWNWYGSWPMANIRMANALKLLEYDFHFSFGTGSHNPAQGEAEFPASMIWLWRDYDAAKTSQTYAMEPAERAKPVFRVFIANRDSE